jgi:malate dehydrogenase (oxaloacetate-decarboxylating)
VIVNGAGAAGNSVTRLLLSSGVKNIIMCDRTGALYENMDRGDAEKKEISRLTNPERVQGTLAEVIEGTDVFIGVSAPGVLSADMVSTMNKDSIVFAMANPTPEIFPDEAKKAGVRIIGTGRSDYPNQVNNVLAFPGVFRGALDVRAREINEEMKVAAAYAIAGAISENELSEDNIIPKAFNRAVQSKVAEAVRKAAIKSGAARE